MGQVIAVAQVPHRVTEKPSSSGAVTSAPHHGQAAVTVELASELDHNIDRAIM